MRNKAGIICVLLGVVLIISALLLFSYNQSESQRADENSQKAVNALQDYIEDNHDKDIKSAMIDGYEYIGYIILPDIDRELPVLAESDEQRLMLAPCRDVGSVETDDLVIAAHNYDAHFGRLGQLSYGSKVYFTDMDGNKVVYSLVELSTLQPTEVDRVHNSGCDLVLYTCTYGGKTRIVAFFNRID